MNAVTEEGPATGPLFTVSYDQEVVAYDPATSELSVTAEALADGFELRLTTLDAANDVTGVYLLSARLLGLPPLAVGTIADLVLEQGAAAAGVPASEAFSGAELDFALEAAPAGVTIDPVTGVVNVSTAAVVDAAPVTVRAQNAAGSATQSFRVTVRSSMIATVFSDASSLGQVTFLASVAPQWTFVSEGFARLIPAGKSRAHGDWAGARGDGLYRALVRWSGATLTPSVDRRFSFGARVRRNGNDWYGVRIETFSTTAGDRRLHIREYTGSASNTQSLATTSVGWSYDTWYWFEVEIAGASVRGRLYAENGAAPDWQVSATTSYVAAGAFGAGGFPAADQSPVIDVRRLEYHPLAS